MPRRNTLRLLRNENRDLIRRLLKEVKELKEAYQSAPATMDRCDHLVSSISGRLRTDQVTRALDTLLRDEHERDLAGFLVDLQRSDLKDEIELSADFGYSSKEVKDYVRRARQESRPTGRHLIAVTADLIRELKALHAQATNDMVMTDPELKPWQLARAAKRALALKRAREDVQYRLYCVGAIIADGMTSDLFDTSYAIGTSGLANAARDE